MNSIRFLFVCLSLLATICARGQQASFITILDSKTNEAIPYAHVSFKSLLEDEIANGISDETGRLENVARNRSIIGVSCVGFKTYFDTINPGESQIIKLIPEILNIDELVVTAQFTPERADNSIYRVKVINSQQIEQKGANNLMELLGSELNVRTSQSGVLGSSMSLQGMGGEHIKYLINGIPVIGRMNGNIDITQLNLHNADHLEVIEGPMSVIYGSNALAGVINIITRENKNYKFFGQANSYIESVGIYNFNGNASIKENNHIVQLSGGRDFFGGYSLDKNSRWKYWRPKRQHFFDGMYIYDREKLKLKASSSYYNELLKNLGEASLPYKESVIDNYFFTTRFNNSIDAAFKLPANRFLSVLTAYSLYKREKETWLKDLTTLEKVKTPNLSDHDTSYINSYILRSTYSKSDEDSKFNYQMGLDLNLETGRGKRIDDGKQKIGDYAAFLSIKYQPFIRLLVQPGARLIYNTKYEAPLVYSINLKYDMIAELSMRASYARGFRSPSIKELYLSFEDVNHDIHGNKDLQAENSHNVNLSFVYHADRDEHVYEAEAAFFYNDIHNSIRLAQITENYDASKPPPYTYINVLNYITQGGQLNLNYRYYPNFSIKAGLVRTGIYSSFYDDGSERSKSLYYTDMNSAVKYKIVKHDINISLFYKYSGRKPQYYLNDDGEVKAGYISDFHTMDFTISKNFFENKLLLAVGVKNIFDNTIIPSLGYSAVGHGSGGGDYAAGWGRTYFINASYTIKRID